MKDKLNEALQEISDAHIEEALASKAKKKLPTWCKLVAAALVLVVLTGLIGPSFSLQAAAVAQATYPEYRYTNAGPEMTAPLRPFFQASMASALSDLQGQNGAYSPMNLVIGLSALAELTSGDARQQILTALGMPDMQTLRQNANQLWRATYYDKDNQTLLANSLWLDNSVDFSQDAMNALASNYYTSVYRGDLGSSQVNRLISQWLNQQTKGFLKQETAGVQLSPETVLALYSTIYYQAKWQNEFSAGSNSNDIFHASSGDKAVTYMNKTKMAGTYFWAEDFGAVPLYLKGGTTMWLFLPDEGKTVEDILASEVYLDMLYFKSENSKAMYINLSIPKFDIRQSSNLRSSLESMGITDVFDPAADSFAETVYSHKLGTGVWLSGANQSTRVAIDEKGVTAASYLEFPGAGAAQPPTEEIDFILDRPFFFVITRGSLPLFAGVVNEP